MEARGSSPSHSINQGGKDFMKERNAEGAKTAMSLHIIHTIDSFGFKDRLV